MHRATGPRRRRTRKVRDPGVRGHCACVRTCACGCANECAHSTHAAPAPCLPACALPPSLPPPSLAPLTSQVMPLGTLSASCSALRCRRVAAATSALLRHTWGCRGAPEGRGCNQGKAGPPRAARVRHTLGTATYDMTHSPHQLAGMTRDGLPVAGLVHRRARCMHGPAPRAPASPPHLGPHGPVRLLACRCRWPGWAGGAHGRGGRGSGQG